jgi:hypothetical protein
MCCRSHDQRAARGKMFAQSLTSAAVASTTGGQRAARAELGTPAAFQWVAASIAMDAIGTPRSRQ